MWVTRPASILPIPVAEKDAGRVECYSGHTYAQEPRAFGWQGDRYRVLQVLERWRTPAGPAFRVQADVEGEFELVYDEAADRWTIRNLTETEQIENEEVQVP